MDLQQFREKFNKAIIDSETSTLLQTQLMELVIDMYSVVNSIACETIGTPEQVKKVLMTAGIDEALVNAHVEKTFAPQRVIYEFDKFLNERQTA